VNRANAGNRHTDARPIADAALIGAKIQRLSTGKRTPSRHSVTKGAGSAQATASAACAAARAV
jgi:hypothetical protein